jgi:DNA-binding beta-propeller fold protein YncE
MATTTVTRGWSSALLLAALLALASGPLPAGAQAGGVPGDSPARAGYEVWSLDQGTDQIHVYSSLDYRRVATIDVRPAALAGRGFQHVPAGPRTVPHMIDFDSQDRYAFVAATAGAATIVIDARSKEVVEVLGTGAGSHMVAVRPDDSAAWVAAIGSQELVEITLGRLNSGRPTFELSARLKVSELLAPIEAANPTWLPADPVVAQPFKYVSYSPVCHQYSPDGTEAWVTLGPGWQQGGLFVLDLATHEVTAAWEPNVVKANCGVSVTADIAVANWSGRVVQDADTAGEWYVFDRVSKVLLGTPRSAAFGAVEGLDAHALRLTPDGSSYWMVNRSSSDGLVIDAETFTVTLEITSGLDTPDILDFAPDSSRVFVSQRGPLPVSGAPHAATGDEPGVVVLDATTGQRVAFLAPPVALNSNGVVLNDIHGVGVRTVGPGERRGHDRADAVRPPGSR